ncbi:MAG: Hsp20/alpha crystallin family protein [Candidatus Aminicenantes bacterium]|nr:Hsp20/alpha crystallin family protein [Candidatus Aminicenantes bacterium]
MAKKNYPFFDLNEEIGFPTGISTSKDWEPSTNIFETDKSIVIEMELAGVIIEDISITLEDAKELIVKGIKKQSWLQETGIKYYLFERKFGDFFKRIHIDVPIDTENIRSVMENGVLIIEVFKKVTEKITVRIK